MVAGESSNPASYPMTEGAADDLYFSALLSEEGHEQELFPIADDKYAEALQFQEVLYASYTMGSVTVNSNFNSKEGNVQGAADQPSSYIDSLPSSSSPSFVACTICAEDTLRPEDMFKGKMRCSHLFCNACIARHIASKVQESNISSLACPEPGCGAAIEPEHCKGIIPVQVFDRWCDVLCESVVLSESCSAAQTNLLKSTVTASTSTPIRVLPSTESNFAGAIYCPFSDCSALLVDDSGEQVTRAECPSCHRLFCARCKGPWHATVAAEYTCEENQRGFYDENRKNLDLMLVDLAESKKWKRCPRCKFFVEKTEGCIHITCRCSFQFCYGCGAEWGNPHLTTCQN